MNLLAHTTTTFAPCALVTEKTIPTYNQMRARGTMKFGRPSIIAEHPEFGPVESLIADRLSVDGFKFTRIIGQNKNGLNSDFIEETLEGVEGNPTAIIKDVLSGGDRYIFMFKEPTNAHVRVRGTSGDVILRSTGGRCVRLDFGNMGWDGEAPNPTLALKVTQIVSHSIGSFEYSNPGGLLANGRSYGFDQYLKSISVGPGKHIYWYSNAASTVRLPSISAALKPL